MAQEPERVALETTDPSAGPRALFASLFPGVMQDGVIDADRLTSLLDAPISHASDARERFGLAWAGKTEAVEALRTPSRATLTPDLRHSISFDTASHVFIEGDNLEVLKLLQKAYNDRVKLIYIDPPYNTGSNDFIYPDDFSDTLRAYLDYTGQLDEEGKRTSTAADTLGRRHSKWLSMMYPRLVLARNLLTQDGVIFISIDDNEVANLREIMDEIFGPENFIASVVWQKVYSPMNSVTQFALVHDYVLVYGRNAAEWQANLLPRTEEQDRSYQNPDDDPRGPWKADNFTAPAGHATPSQTYELVSPSGNKFWPPAGRAWVYTEPRYRELLADGRVWFGKDGQNRPAIKRFLSEVKQGRVAQTFWPYQEVGHNQDAKRELLARVTFSSSDSVFDTPKPTKLVRRMLSLGTQPSTSDVVLDFFAGSGSTADAVLQQNAEDGGNRKFIVVQLPEPTGYADYPLVSDITRARIRSAMEEASRSLVNSSPVGLREFRLSRSNFHRATASKDLIDLAEQTLPETPDLQSVVAEVLLKEGVTLDASWARHTVAGGTEIVVADGIAVVLCLAITDQIAQAALDLDPRVLVFLEDGFAGRDTVKANVFWSAQQRGVTMKTV